MEDLLWYINYFKEDPLDKVAQAKQGTEFENK